MRRFTQFVCLFALGLSSAAYAATIPAGIYNLNNVTVQDSAHQGFMLTGNVTIGDNGLVTAANIMLNDAKIGTPAFNFTTIATGSGGDAPVADYAYIAGSAGQLALFYTPSLDPSGNIDLCILKSSCNDYQGSYLQLYGSSSFGYDRVFLTSGTLIDPPAAPIAPEPASLVLLMTGLAGFAGAAGFKYLKA